MLGARAVHPFVLSLSMTLAACGGNVVFVGDGETTGGGGSGSSVTSGGGLDCGDVSFDLDVPAMVCTNGSETCDMTGQLPDGRAVSERCDGTTLMCSLYVDDVLTCSCPAERIDFASVCPNSVPTCSGWRLNWSTAELCIIN